MYRGCLLVLVGLVTLALAQREALPGPDVDLSPEEVVRAQLEALQQNDVPFENAGIETAFAFASPANKRATGPLPRFVLLVNSPAYRPMIDHVLAQYGAFETVGNIARGRAVLTTEDGERVGYIFTLSKQRAGEFRGMWMTDSVQRYELEPRQQV